MNKDERKRLETLQKNGKEGVGTWQLEKITVPDLQLLLVADSTIQSLIRQICSPATDLLPVTLLIEDGTNDEAENTPARPGKKEDLKKDALKQALQDEKESVKNLANQIQALQSELAKVQSELNTTRSNLSDNQRYLQVKQREFEQLQVKLKTPPMHPLLVQLAPELTLLQTVQADSELTQLWRLDSMEPQGRQLTRLLSNITDWDDGICALWQKLSERCKAAQRMATVTEKAMLQTALDLHNLRYKNHAATLTEVEHGASFHHETMERGTPKGSTVSQVWLPGLNNAGGTVVKKPVVQTV